MGTEDDRWDDLTLRVQAGRKWEESGFQRLEALIFDDLLPVHEEAARYGRTTARGLVKRHFMEGIWNEFQGHLVERLDPIYIATRWVKHSVMHRPFRDANRRTAFLWAAVLFDAFDIYIRVDTPEAINYKKQVRNESFMETYEWFDRQVERTQP